MTVDLTTVKAGDKLHTRQGDVLVVYDIGVLSTAFARLHEWRISGEWLKECSTPHDLDIIGIEKHEPVVEEYYMTKSKYASEPALNDYKQTGEWVLDQYKITITDGVPSIEKVGE